MKLRSLSLLFGLFLLPQPAPAAHPPPDLPATLNARMLGEYFRTETGILASECLSNIKSIEYWHAKRGKLRQELLDMLGLSPMPPRGDLKPVITGRIENESIIVENLHFQSVPGLYVTANLYLPKTLPKPAPTILYVCGHGPVISNKVSYGNKVSYQHHGAWFARNGYVCLVIDTVQLGEILGVHHGTYREGMWWWNSRGYTPAGVETWSAVRALDYLSTRPEVDTNRFGITGRSGGGAYSWFTAAIDDRVKVIAPVAGITDLQNHVVDGTVEGHCDCMFFVNTYRWDYPTLAALAAPRPLLLVNTDSDTIFPLDGVMRTHGRVKQIYELCHAATNLGLVIGPGPHKDTPDLQVPVFRWFNKHLKGEDPIIEMAATKLFTPQQLKVFSTLPADAINTNVHHTFVARAPQPAVPRSAEEWRQQCDQWLAALRARTFAGWPEQVKPVALEKRVSTERLGLRFQTFDFESQPNVRLRLYSLQNAAVTKPRNVVLTIVGPSALMSLANAREPGVGSDFRNWLAMLRSEFGGDLAEELAAVTPAPEANRAAFAALAGSLRTNATLQLWLVPRGIGLTALPGDERQQAHQRRRYMLLGQTLDSMRVWDIRRAVQAVQTQEQWRSLPLTLRGADQMACDALYAALFQPGIAVLDLWRLPSSHEQDPDYLNVLRVLDVPQAAAMATERCAVHLHECAPGAWAYPLGVGTALGWKESGFRLVR